MRIRKFKLPQLNLKKVLKRHKLKLTFKGEDGKLLRRIAVGVAALVLIIIIVNAMRVEPQLMNSAEMLSLKDKGIVSIGVRDDTEGFGLDGEGIEVELAKRLADMLLPSDGSTVRDKEAYELITVNSMTVEPKLDDGSIDVAIAMMKKGASSAYSYSRAYYSDPCVVIVKEGKTMSESALAGKTIAYLGTITTSVKTPIMKSVIDAYVESVEGLELTAAPYASYADIFSALEKDKADAAVIPRSAVRKYEDTQSFKVTDVTLGKINYAIACSTDYPAFITVANMMLSEMESDGSLDALLKKYGLE